MSHPPYRATPPWPVIDNLAPDVGVAVPRIGGWYAAARPVVEFLFAVALLVPGLPLIAVCWVLVRLTSSGSGFYCQTRAGQGGRPYRIVKLRTMTHNAEARSGILWSHKGDTRITRLGRFLRATHLDELPQLFNVLRGEMSLVGPRPERPEVIRGKGLCELVPGYDQRLAVKPGVTGLAQLQLPADSDLRGVRHKVAYDVYYIANRTLWLDLRLVVATAMKTAGIGPHTIRVLFRLPTRDEVAHGFLRCVGPMQPEPEPSSAEFQTI